MIKYNSKLWLRYIFMLHKSDTLRILLPEMVIVALYTLGLTYLEMHYFEDNVIFKDTIAIHSLVGFVLSLLLVFRTNTAYDRWWEGRKQWGAMVNNCRSLSITLDAILPKEETKLRTFFSKMIPNYVFAMKEHLREGIKLNELEDEEGLFLEIERKKHIPNYIASKIYHKINKLNTKKVISFEHFLVLDNRLKSFTDIIGACERIKNTPIPFAYSMFLKKFIFIYMATLPIGLIPVFNYWTIPITIFIFYALVSMEILAEEIEDPFGQDSNDLPGDELSEKIKHNVKEILLDK